MSLNRAQEVETLSRADEHLIEGERRVTEQIMRIDKLRADGHDMTEAETHLKALEDSLEQWREHRETIRRTIEQIDAGAI